jgi:hypothetical protein
VIAFVKLTQKYEQPRGLVATRWVRYDQIVAVEARIEGNRAGEPEARDGARVTTSYGALILTDESIDEIMAQIETIVKEAS